MNFTYLFHSHSFAFLRCDQNEKQTRKILYISDHFSLEHFRWGAIEKCLINSIIRFGQVWLSASRSLLNRTALALLSSPSIMPPSTEERRRVKFEFSLSSSAETNVKKMKMIDDEQVDVAGDLCAQGEYHEARRRTIPPSLQGCTLIFLFAFSYFFDWVDRMTG